MTRGAPARRGPRPFALHLTAARAAWAGPDASREDRQRFVAFVEGVRRYHAHPFRRPVRERPVVWSAGSSRLLDGGQPGGWPVLIVPSMINRSAILDLLPVGVLIVDSNGSFHANREFTRMIELRDEPEGSIQDLIDAQGHRRMFERLGEGLFVVVEAEADVGVAVQGDQLVELAAAR